MSAETSFQFGDPCPYCGEPMRRVVKLAGGYGHTDCLMDQDHPIWSTPTPPVAPAANERAMGGDQR